MDSAPRRRVLIGRPVPGRDALPLEAGTEVGKLELRPSASLRQFTGHNADPLALPARKFLQKTGFLEKCRMQTYLCLGLHFASLSRTTWSGFFCLRIIMRWHISCPIPANMTTSPNRHSLRVQDRVVDLSRGRSPAHGPPWWERCSWLGLPGAPSKSDSSRGDMRRNTARRGWVSLESPGRCPGLACQGALALTPAYRFEVRRSRSLPQFFPISLARRDVFG
jgi:hypothetical protein